MKRVVVVFEKKRKKEQLCGVFLTAEEDLFMFSATLVKNLSRAQSNDYIVQVYNEDEWSLHRLVDKAVVNNEVYAVRQKPIETFVFTFIQSMPKKG